MLKFLIKLKKSYVLIIARKEFFGFLNSALSFVVIVPFLLISSFIYLRSSLVVGEASLRPFFDVLPWFLMVLVSALSMRIFSSEQESGTLELLFAHPLSETGIVLGKFLGLLGFYLVILASTLLLPISLLIFANPDPGVLIAQYLGAIFMGGVFLSIGIFSSALVRNNLSSFLLSAAISFIFILIGLDFVSLMFPGILGEIVRELALSTHVNNIARGVLDLRDILYFLTLIAIFLIAAVIKLSTRKFAENKLEKTKLIMALILTIGIGVVLNVLVSFYPLRLDLTSQKLFTLSLGTVQTLEKLPDILTITVYTTSNLPPQMQTNLQDIEDTLSDYQRLNSKLKVQTIYIDRDTKARSEAQSLGIQQVNFNQIGQGQFNVLTGSLGIGFRYGSKTAVIPFVQDTSDLEYQLTQRIRKLTSPKQTSIGIYQSGFGSYQTLTDTLSSQYDVQTLTLDDLQNQDKLKSLSAMVVIDDGTAESTASALLKNYLSAGGKMLFLGSKVNVNDQLLSAQASKSNVSDFLKDYGVSINSDLVYDTKLNETLTFGNGTGSSYLVPYAYWLKALPQDTSFPALTGLNSITLGWPSSLTISKQTGYSYKDLLSTSPSSGKVTDTFDISPTALNSLTPSGGPFTMAEDIENNNTKLLIVSDSEFATDQSVQNLPEDLSFLANSVDYLAADKDVALIPRKTQTKAVFHFSNSFSLAFFQYGDLLIPPVAVIAFALFWLSRRKRLFSRNYEA